MTWNSRLLKIIGYLLPLFILFVTISCGSSLETVDDPIHIPSPTPLAESKISVIVEELGGLYIDSFFRQSFLELLLREPEMLTIWGLSGELGLRNDRLNNLSEEYLLDTQKLEAEILALLRSYDRDSLTADQKINYDVYEWYLDTQIRGHPYLYHDYQLHHFIGSYHFNLNSLLTKIHPLRNVEDVQDYISRLSLVNTQVNQLLTFVKTAEKRGIIPPKFIIELTRDDLLSYLNLDPQSPLDVDSLDVYTHLETALKTMSELSPDDITKLLEEAKSQIEKSYVPGFVKIIDYQDHLLTVSTDDAGAWKLPDGVGYYAYKLRRGTSTDLTPEEVHKIGLDEVSRIQKEMGLVLIDMGYSEYGGLESMLQRAVVDFGYYEISTDQGRAEIVNDCKAFVSEMESRMWEISDLKPVVDLVVMGDEVPEFYLQGGIPGIRPGVFFVAWLGDSYPKYSVRTTAYHEAIPGHHYQDAIAKGTPLYLHRYAGDGVAYSEGWALYAERLAYEMGMYVDDPYGNLGRLQGELLRAVRLVADTGIHSMGWTREEAKNYVDQATLVPGENTSEVDRYIVIPAQATGYKIGMLKILELRQDMEVAMGANFDLKSFHNVVLGFGILPLKILEQVVYDFGQAHIGN